MLNEELVISANKVYLEDRVGVFKCYIKRDGQDIASAQLNAFLPSDSEIQNILKGRQAI